MEERLELQEFLDVLPSPAFILDLREYGRTTINDINPDSIRFVVVNKSAKGVLGNVAMREVNDNPSFRQWLLRPSSAQETFEGDDLEFTSNVIRDRYKVIQTKPRLRTPSPRLPGERLSSSWTEAWSRYAPQRHPELHKQHLQHLLSKDWSKTAMGPIDLWPQSLRTISSYVMNCPFPCALYWGEDLAVFYNHEYITIAQAKHPRVLGEPYRIAWPELWAEDLHVKQRLILGMTEGASTRFDNDALFLNRSNVPMEETYIDWGLVPFPREPGDERELLRGTGGRVRMAAKGKVGGLVNPVFENTTRVIMDRRLKLLREMGQRVTSARATQEFWGIVMSALGEDAIDVPGCVAYGLQNPSEGTLRIMGRIGIGDDPYFPESLNLSELSDSGFEKAVRDLGDSVVMLEDVPILEKFEKRGWGDPLRRAVLVPIKPSTTRPPQGILFLALSSRRPYDEDYSIFIELLTRQIATSLTNVQLLEEEIRRAESDRRKGEELERALAQRTRELRASEGFMGRLAEICPVGIFVSDGSGNISFVNDTWYEITAYPRSLNASDWLSHLHPDDISEVSKLWHRVLRGAGQINCEFRWLHPSDEGYSSAEDLVTWCSMAVAPELDEGGNVIRVFGAIVDISERKRAEAEKQRQFEEAVELRRQQENFIDMTSHEMRNPLSAILQSSDTVFQCLTRAKAVLPADIIPPEIDDALDAIQTVMLCSNHQKRIIDDTLTMSKLDSRLLLVTPVDTQPVSVVEKVIRMFENDFSHKDITAELVVHPSYHAFNIDWVKADPSRFTQVLVNLLTNAIKFTTGSKVRHITVTVGPIWSDRPDLEGSQITSPNVSPPTERDVLFLGFSVADTGSGLSEKEKAILFQRFTQATPETHIVHGGSGLGLFICRKLTELQGGQITVESEQGKGSTFSFYIETKRSPGPPPKIGEDPKVAAATELTKSRTEASFLQNTFIHGEGGKAHQRKINRQRRPSVVGSANYNVLIVEDNPINQQVLAKQLQLADCRSAIAKNGKEALDMLSQSTFAKEHAAEAPSYDVCLMDIEMPVMDGLTACHRIRDLEKSGELRHVPLIAVTANARKEQTENMIKEGFDDVLTKPFQLPDLLGLMEGVLVRTREQT